jgi:hypothetical protein
MLRGSHQRQPGEDDDQRPALTCALLQQGSERGKLGTGCQMRLIQRQHNAAVASARELHECREHSPQGGGGLLLRVGGTCKLNLAANTRQPSMHRHRLRPQRPLAAGLLDQLIRATYGLDEVGRERRARAQLHMHSRPPEPRARDRGRF